MIYPILFEKNTEMKEVKLRVFRYWLGRQRIFSRTHEAPFYCSTDLLPRAMTI
jgi:hypothetical protein